VSEENAHRVRQTRFNEKADGSSEVGIHTGMKLAGGWAGQVLAVFLDWVFEEGQRIRSGTAGNRERRAVAATIQDGRQSGKTGRAMAFFLARRTTVPATQYVALDGA
jgi:hypothetical protein